MRTFHLSDTIAIVAMIGHSSLELILITYASGYPMPISGAKLPLANRPAILHPITNSDEPQDHLEIVNYLVS
jgi:hypothetical protein